MKESAPFSTPKGNTMRFSLAAIFLTLIFLLCSCNDLQSIDEADTFFSGCAYLDSNSNREIDPDDRGLKDAVFVVTLKGGAGFGAFTSESGCALVTVPGGLSEESWPITARMEPPEGSGYELVSPAEVVLEYPDCQADFLFTNP